MLKILEEENVKITSNLGERNSYVHVKFIPAKEWNEIVSGQLVLLYDVTRNKNGGQIQVMNDYFVHFFAPAIAPASRKTILFVVDKSTSMLRHNKYYQTKVL